MDPKKPTTAQPPPAAQDDLDLQTEIWEPPFERWLRLTEALTNNAANPVRDFPVAFRQSGT